MKKPDVTPSTQNTSAQQLVLALGAGVFLVACGAEVPQRVSAATPTELEQLLPTLQPGDEVEVEGVRLLVPPEQQGLHVEILFENGRTASFSLETKASGEVNMVRPMDFHDDTSMMSSAASACSNGAYSLLPHKWRTPYRWRFNASSTPTYLTASAAEKSVVEAVRSIVGSRNSCGLGDAVAASQEYLGRTTLKAQVRASGTCGNADGHNVTSFGDLPAGMLAAACTWYDHNGQAMDGDVLINKADHRWVTSLSGCTGRYHLQAAMTHEFGHVFGLGHAPQGSQLTMAPTMPPCDAAASTLGLGDVRGLRKKY